MATQSVSFPPPSPPKVKFLDQTLAWFVELVAKISARVSINTLPLSLESDL